MLCPNINLVNTAYSRLFLLFFSIDSNKPFWCFPSDSAAKNPPAMQETLV